MSEKGLSELSLACTRGNLDTIEEILIRAPDEINIITSRGRCPAEIALSYGYFDICKRLIYTRGFNFFLRPQFPVLIAKHTELFDAFLEKELNNPKIVAIYSTLLDKCCLGSNFKGIQSLLGDCQVVPVEQRVLDEFKCSILLRNGAEGLKFLMERFPNHLKNFNLHCAAVQSGLLEYFYKFPPKLSKIPEIIRSALRFGRKEILDHLEKLKPAEFNEILINSLRIVCPRAVLSNLEFLFTLARDKFPTADDIFFNLARKCVIENHFPVLKMILEFNGNRKDLQEEILFESISRNRLEMVKFILSASLIKSKHLHCASSKGHDDIFKILLETISCGFININEQQSILMNCKRIQSVSLAIQRGFTCESDWILFNENFHIAESFEDFLNVYTEHFPISTLFETFNAEGNSLLHIFASRHNLKALETLNSSYPQEFSISFYSKLNGERKTPCKILLRAVTYNRILANKKNLKRFLLNQKPALPLADLNFCLQLCKERNNKKARFLFYQLLE